MLKYDDDYHENSDFAIKRSVIPMNYLPLLRYKYFITGQTGDPSKVEDEYQARINSYTVQKTSLFPLLSFQNRVQTSQYPIFFLPLPRIQNLADQLRRNSNQIKQIVATLPKVAIDQFSNSLLLSEIFYTNDIEGVRTSQVEISTVIQENNHGTDDDYVSPHRLGSTIKMYQRTQKGAKVQITTLTDWRQIYDSLLYGEIDQSRQPNGKLFRDQLPNGEMLTIGNGSQVVHRPPVSEEAIQAALSALTNYMNDDETPAIYKALVTHFFFENTHPFLDGNGRMGRYLLSTYLSNQFDHFTGFSVATAIHSNIQQYYKIFRETDRAENRADLTFFIERLLKILTDQQSNLIERMMRSKAQLNKAHWLNQSWVQEKQGQLLLPADLYLHLLDVLAQSELFTNRIDLGIKDNDILAKLKKDYGHPKTKLRAAISQLEQLGAIKLIAKRPKQHLLNII
ncbi:Fic family protein [Limosilactobacillus difficilis]|uniref:Fic family protein n=1 Tax=Limosilactobacillus difficilis TaxID=2991838 RepID=UPI0024B8E925|nr:Fic family protein [Limosilactobacillus difficilis]